jgi:hypothetical protein
MTIQCVIDTPMTLVASILHVAKVTVAHVHDVLYRYQHGPSSLRCPWVVCGLVPHFLTNVLARVCCKCHLIVDIDVPPPLCTSRRSLDCACVRALAIALVLLQESYEHREAHRHEHVSMVRSPMMQMQLCGEQECTQARDVRPLVRKLT